MEKSLKSLADTMNVATKCQNVLCISNHKEQIDFNTNDRTKDPVFPIRINDTETGKRERGV